MEGRPQFDRMVASRYYQQKVKDVFNRTWPLVWENIPREERGGFIQILAEDYLGLLLLDMSREERAALMNGLLPLFAREFPLADLDLLAAFPFPQKADGESPDEAEVW